VGRGARPRPARAPGPTATAATVRRALHAIRRTSINTGPRDADTTGVKPGLRRDVLFGGSAGAAVVATIALSVTTMGSMLGTEWGLDAPIAADEQVNMPSAAQLAALPAPAAPRVRVSLQRDAEAQDEPEAAPAPSRRRASRSGSRRRETSRRADVPATTLPPAAAPEPATSTTTPAATVTAAAAAPASTPAATRARAVTLRVASVAVADNEDEGTPELRVALVIANDAATAGVPEQVTLRLRPDLPDAPQPAGAALALRAHIDVVDSPVTGTPSPLQMRVRMTFAAAESSQPTVADRGDGDGQSNVLDVAVPLSALAENAPDGQQPTPPPATPPAEASAESEIRLDLMHPAEAGDEVEETTDVAVPADPAGEQPGDSVPVTVVVQGSPAPEAPEAPAAETATAPAAAPVSP
jgi:hypothetical protein